MIKTLFLGTPLFAHHCLQALLEDSDYQVVGVVSQPDSFQNRHMKLTPSPVKNLSLQHKLPLLTPQNINHPQVFKALKALNAELCVVVAYGQILSSKFLALYPENVVNLHGSLLPRWRGSAPIQRALMAGDSTTGMTLQKVAEALDEGDVISQKKITLKDENADQVFKILEQKSIEILKNELKQYVRKEIKVLPQDESFVTYAPKIKKKEARLYWSQEALSLHNKIRGLFLGPQAFCFLDKKQTLSLKITQSEVSSCLPHHKLGEITQISSHFFTVACHNLTALKVLKVKKASKKEMSVAEFLRGCKLKEKMLIY